MKKKKIDFFQIIRGICIIGVIIIHSVLQTENETILKYNIILRGIVNFCVAIFIFLSGYFINIEKMQKNTKNYMLNKLNRIIIPYLFWTIIYLSRFLIRGELSIEKIIAAIFFGTSSAQMYFIPVLIQLILISPFIIKSIRNKKFESLFVLSTFLYIILVYVYKFITKAELPFYATLFPAWIVFYYLGIKFKIEGIGNIKKFNIKKIIVIALFFIILEILEGFILNNYGLYTFAVSQSKLSSIMYSISIIYLIIALKQNGKEIKSKILGIIGDYSFGIYLIHTIYLLIIGKIFKILNIELPIVLNEVILTSIIIVFSIITIKIFEKTRLKVLFGIR